MIRSVRLGLFALACLTVVVVVLWDLADPLGPYRLVGSWGLPSRLIDGLERLDRASASETSAVWIPLVLLGTACLIGEPSRQLLAALLWCVTGALVGFVVAYAAVESIRWAAVGLGGRGADTLENVLRNVAYDLVRSAFPSLASRESGSGRIVDMAVIVGACGGLFWPFSSWATVKPITEVDHDVDLLTGRANLRGLARRLRPRRGNVFVGELVDGESRWRRRRRLYMSVQDRASIVGPPGTGKTVFLMTQLLDWTSSGLSFVCLDVKPEIVDLARADLERAGYRVVVWNPTDPAQTVTYDPLGDATSSIALTELVASFIASNGDGREQIEQGARQVLEAIIRYLIATGKPVSLPTIQNMVDQVRDERQLLEMLGRTDDRDVVALARAISREAQNPRFIALVNSKINSDMSYLRNPDVRRSLANASENDTGDAFALSELLEGKVALFIQFDQEYRKTTGQLLSAVVGHVLRWLIANRKQRDPVLLLLDEIGNTPTIAGLAETLALMRDANLPTVMYWQGIDQMAKYGAPNVRGVNAIMKACSLQGAFRLDDTDSADWFSARFSTIYRTHTAVATPDGIDPRGSPSDGSRTTSKREEPAVKPGDLQHLPDGQMVAVYKGQGFRARATPYFERRSHRRGRY